MEWTAYKSYLELLFILMLRNTFNSNQPSRYPRLNDDYIPQDVMSFKNGRAGLN